MFYFFITVPDSAISTRLPPGSTNPKDEPSKNGLIGIIIGVLVAGFAIGVIVMLILQRYKINQ